jgi:hypothetical protein
VNVEERERILRALIRRFQAERFVEVDRHRLELEILDVIEGEADWLPAESPE